MQIALPFGDAKYEFHLQLMEFLINGSNFEHRLLADAGSVLVVEVLNVGGT